MNAFHYHVLGRAALAVALLGGFFLAGAAGAGTARADEVATIPVTIKEHQFAPADIHVAAGKPAILMVKNADGTAEEFDSSALKVEKVIAPGATAQVRLRPLSPGQYPFMGEYHAKTARGTVIAE